MQELVTDLLVFSRFADEPLDGEMLADDELDHHPQAGVELVTPAGSREAVMPESEQAPAPL